MISQVSKWGNSQGVRINKKLLHSVGIRVNDEVEIYVSENALVIKPVVKKTIDWYLEGYDGEPDRYDWGEDDSPKGREIF